MTLFEFGKQLLQTRDLDPLYTVLYAAKLPRSQLAEVMLAYWCFYDLGTSAWIASEPNLFWSRMNLAAASKEYPRGGDRRHFRGQTAIRSVSELEARGESALALLNYLGASNRPSTLAATMGRVRSLWGFGPTIAFKAADMLERFGFATLTASEADATLISETPRSGAEALAGQEGAKLEGADRWAVKRILSVLGASLAPPRYERPISVLEAETMLCKWKHYLNGSYTIGKGIKAQRTGLERFPDCPLALHLLEAGRRARLWK